MPHESHETKNEIHIAGIIVQARPDAARAACAQIERLPGAQVHAASDDGRLVVTLEHGSTRRTVECMDAIRALPGVLDAILVYQHAESAIEMNEEVET